MRPVRIGCSGWSYDDWRGAFYPADVPRKRWLETYAETFDTVEVNNTFYRLPKQSAVAGWSEQTPPGFLFACKASRYLTHIKRLQTVAEGAARFLALLEPLREAGKLGPILWQFAPTKKFDPADFGAFLALLPHKVGNRAVRHVVEVRHASFCVPEFIALARDHDVPIVYAEHETYPEIADVTGDFIYARLQKGKDEEKTGYAPKALDAWAGRFKAWAEGGAPDDLPLIDKKTKPAKKPRDAFVYFIHEGKVRAPHAAMALMERIGK